MSAETSKQKKGRMILFLVLVLFILCASCFVICSITAGLTKNLDMLPAYISLVILLLAGLSFLVEALPVSVTALLIPVALVCLGVCTPSAAFSGLSNDSVIMFAGMFVVGNALFRTGVADAIGAFVVKISHGKPEFIMIGMFLVTAAFSSVMSNTGTVAVLLPICIAIADSSHMKRKRLLLPLAIMSSTGGMITIAGTPPNATVSAIATQYGQSAFSFFEYAWLGVPITLLSGVFLWLVFRRNGTASKPVSQYAVDRTGAPPVQRWKQVVSVLVLLSVVFVMVSGKISLGTVAVLGALVCILLGVVTPPEAVQAIDWSTIFLFAGTLSLATALETTGAGRLIAHAVIGALGDTPSEFALLTALFFICAALTQFMSNTASCALLAPIGMEIAFGLNASPKGVLIVIAIASSAAFITPIGTPANALVYGPGELHFSDYLRVGTPLLLLTYIACIVIVPFVWPLL